MQALKKSWVALVICCLGIVGVNAQPILLSESFESGTFPPTGWALINGGTGAMFTHSWSLGYHGNFSMMVNNTTSVPTNAWAISPGINLNTNPVFVSFFVRAQSNIAMEKLRVSIGSNPSIAGMQNVMMDSVNINYTNYRRWRFVFNPLSAGIYHLGFNAWSTGLAGTLHIDSISVKQTYLPCTGSPAAGNVNASLNSVCNTTTPVQFSVLNDTRRQDGLRYQWFTSTDGVNYTTGQADTLTTLTRVVSTDSFWAKRRILCNYTGLSAETSPAFVVMQKSQFASLPFSDDFDNGWTSKCGIRDVPNLFFQNEYANGEASWRRSDDGASAGWNNTGAGASGTPFFNGTNSARFHSSAVGAGHPGGRLNVFINNDTVRFLRISFAYLNSSTFYSQDSLNVLISQDSGKTFQRVPNGSFQGTSGWIRRSVDVSTTVPGTVIALQGKTQNSSYFIEASDIYVDSLRITALTGCSGSPSTGPIVNAALPNVCGTTFFVDLSVTDSNANVVGLTHQWQVRTVNGNGGWRNIAGANMAKYHSGYMNFLADSQRVFRRITYCGTFSSISGEYVTLFPGQKFANTPYNTEFSTLWAHQCEARVRPDSSWVQMSRLGSNSWRNSKDPNVTWSSYVAAPDSGFFSADYARLATGEMGTDYYGNYRHSDIRLNLNLENSDSNYVLRFAYYNQFGVDTLRIFLSKDSGATFSTQPLVILPAATSTAMGGWRIVSVPFSSNSRRSVLKFAVNSPYGYSPNDDIGIDALEVMNAANCNGLAASSAAQIRAVGCGQAMTFLASVPGVSVAPHSLRHRWESSANNGLTWTRNSADTFYLMQFPNALAGNLVRRKDFCGSDSVAHQAVRLDVNAGLPWATLPFFESFEQTWLATCSNQKKPNAFWTNTFNNNRMVWRASDDVSDIPGVLLADYPTPQAVHGNRSARLTTANGTRNYVNFMANENRLEVRLNFADTFLLKRIGFLARNTSGGDSVEVSISEDSGTTFRQLPLTIGTDAAGWRHRWVIVRSQHSKVVLRFTYQRSANYQAESSDIGLDSLYVSPVPNCGGMPNSSNISGPAFACSGIPITITTNGHADTSMIGGNRYQWQTSTNNGSTWQNLINATSPASVTVGQLIPTWYRLKDSCELSNMVAYSNLLHIPMSGATASYYTLTTSNAYVEEFGNWQTHCTPTQLPSNHWVQANPSGDSSWRRHDQGSSANWTGWLAGGLPATVNLAANPAARFHSRAYRVTGFNTGSMDFYVNNAGVAQTIISFKHAIQAPNDTLMLLISNNGGAQFTKLATFYGNDFLPEGVWRRFSVATNVKSANTIIRVQAKSKYDYYDNADIDMYVDSFVVRGLSCAQPNQLVYNETAKTISWNNANSGRVRLLLQNRTRRMTNQVATVYNDTITQSSFSTASLPTGTYQATLWSFCGVDSSEPTVFRFIQRQNKSCNPNLPLLVRNVHVDSFNVSVSDSTLHTIEKDNNCSYMPGADTGSVLYYKIAATGAALTVRLSNIALIEGSSRSRVRISRATTYSSDCPIWYTGSTSNCTMSDTFLVLPASSVGSFYHLKISSSTPGDTLSAHRFRVSLHAAPPAPQCAPPSYPMPNDTTVPITNVRIRWQSVKWATSYDVYVQTETGGYKEQFIGLTDTAVNLWDTYTYNTRYRYYVTPRGIGGAAAACAANNMIYFRTLSSPVAVLNDNCNTLAAFTLTPINGLLDTLGLTKHSLTYASPSSGLPNPCGIFQNPAKEVWFSFIATATTHDLMLLKKGSTWGTGLAAAVYSGTCGSLTQMQCFNVYNHGGPSVMNALTVGTRYFIRVYFEYGVNSNGDFYIAIANRSAAQANASCAQATLLTGGMAVNGFSSNTLRYNSANFYCNGGSSIYMNSPSFFKVVPQVSGSASIQLTNSGNSSFRPYVAVVSGVNCNVSTAIACGNAGAGQNLTVALNNVVAGETYTIIVGGYHSSSYDENWYNGTFSLVYNGSTLPATLASFTGRAIDNKNLLSWATKSEAQNKGFEVQVSSNGGQQFRSIGFVNSLAAGGNSQQSLSYQFAHVLNTDEAQRPELHYRLAQTDANGRIQHSSTIAIKRSTSQHMLSLASLAPNPATSQVIVTLKTPQIQNLQRAHLVIMDLQGRILAKQPIAAGATQHTLQVSALAKGQYLVRLVCADGCESNTLSFQKQ